MNQTSAPQPRRPLGHRTWDPFLVLGPALPIALWIWSARGLPTTAGFAVLMAAIAACVALAGRRSRTAQLVVLTAAVVVATAVLSVAAT